MQTKKLSIPPSQKNSLPTKKTIPTTKIPKSPLMLKKTKAIPPNTTKPSSAQISAKKKLTTPKNLNKKH